MSSSLNLTRQRLTEHLIGGDLDTGTPIDLSVDQILIEDATGSMTALQFEELGVDRVQVDPTVMYVDHNVLQVDGKNMDEHRYLRTFCARYGLHYSRPGNGISHYVHLERFSAPGGSCSAPTPTPRCPARSGCSPSAPEGSTSRWPWPGTV